MLVMHALSYNYNALFNCVLHQGKGPKNKCSWFSNSDIFSLISERIPQEVLLLLRYDTERKGKKKNCYRLLYVFPFSRLSEKYIFSEGTCDALAIKLFQRRGIFFVCVCVCAGGEAVKTSPQS